MRTKKTILALDFDGVIVDSMPLQEKAWQEALARVTPQIANAAKKVILHNLWSGYAGPRIFENAGFSGEQEKAARIEKDQIWNKSSSAVETMPGAKSALINLSRRLSIYIATTAHRDYVEDILARESLAEYIQGIVTDQDVQRPKPAPDALQKIADSARTDLSQLLVIGDTATDLEMARSAGSAFLLLDVHGRTELTDSNIDRVHSWEEAKRFILRRT